MQPTKHESIEHWASWFESRSKDWIYLTINVVFHRDQVGLNRDTCEAAYRTRILPKLQRRIERATSRWTKALPFDTDLFYYEKEETSLFKRIKNSSPHHIHGLLVVPRNRLFRIWSVDTSNVTKDLEQDLRSLNLLSDWFIEPCRDGGKGRWLTYCTKGGKSF